MSYFSLDLGGILLAVMSGYWRSLWSSLDFADQSLKDCVNIIHYDIVEIWNLNDKNEVCFLSYRLSWLLTGISIYQVINSKQECVTLSKTWLDLPTHHQRKHHLCEIKEMLSGNFS